VAQANKYANFMSLKQIGTVKEYRRSFERFAKGMRDISMSALEGKWESGLKEEIRSAMRKLRPVGIEEKMFMAQVIEDDFAFQAAQNEGSTSATVKAKVGTIGSGTGSTEILSHRTTTFHPTSCKKLTEAEIRARKDKGLCFRCDEQFVPGHRCKKKELQNLDVWVVRDAHDYQNVEVTEFLPEDGTAEGGIRDGTP